jgi:D-threo-aldose 1-dehydrogenase
MRYRRFGRTGLEVSELVLGGGWVGGLLIDADDETRRKALRMALDGGINFIDTAPSYGEGKSEEALGWLLKEVDTQPYLSTKVRLDPTDLDNIPGQVEESVAHSLRRLQRSSVDLIQLHNHITPKGGDGAVGIDHVLGARGAAEALEVMRKEGITRFIGITALGDNSMLQKVVASGLFDSAQVYYNMLNPSAGRPSMPQRFAGGDFSGLIATCKQHDVAVMNIRVLAAGVLATEERHGREVMITDTSVADDDARARRAFVELGDSYGTRAQTAIRFSLAHPDISCVLVGIARLAHLEEALAAAEMGPLPPEALERLEPLYRSDFGRASR